ncbi:MAG: FAD-dependent oxidoreductase [Deltaproteobacteria bacterium]|nr:FAD-dependent oxidoreductase [Deltaproteobacteria bacterium]
MAKDPGGNAFDVVVIGAGVNGLAAAWHTARLGARRSALVEQFRIGHDLGSSHGASRIFRCVYPDARYVRLATRARDEEWPRLERAAGRTLLHPAPAVFFGPPGGAIDSYARAVRDAGAPIDAVSPAEARRRAPAFRFDGAADVLVDGTSALIAAVETLSSLARLCREAGVDVREDTRVLAIEPRTERIDVVTDRGTLETGRVIVAAGPWIAKLLPTIASRFSGARQTIGYFALEGGEATGSLGRFPLWCYLGRDANDFYYGLPQFGRAGVKAARHVTSAVSAVSDDPDAARIAPDEHALADLRAFLDRELSVPVERLAGAESCFYTNTPTEDFVIDALPGEPRIIVGAACSGHAFKFAPLTGRILAELALYGRSDVAELEALRKSFAA